MISDTWNIHMAFTKIGFLGYFYQELTWAGSFIAGVPGAV